MYLGRLIGVAIVLNAVVWAQPVADPFELARREIRVFTDRDGLPQNSIESMALDPLGRLWATTREGLAVYNGADWTSESLPDKSLSNWPRSITATEDGSLWVGAERGGVYRHLNGAWARYGTDDGLPGDQVRLVAEVDLDGTPVLVAGTNGGAAIYRPEENQFEVIEELRRREVTAIVSGGGSLWAGAVPGGLFRHDGNEWTNVTPGSFGDLEVTALLVTAEGLVVGTGEGLYRVDDDVWEMLGQEQIGRSRINALLDISNEQLSGLWVGTDGHGIWIQNDSEWSALDVSNGLGNNFVFDLLVWPNREAPKQVYAGTLSGVSVIRLGGWRVIGESDHLPDRSVVSFLETGSGTDRTWWVGTTHGLARFDRDTWRDLLPSQPVFSLIETEGGRVLAGTETGLVEYRDGMWSPLDAGLPTGSVVALAEERIDDGSRLWVGMYGEGLWVWGDGRLRRAASLPDGRIEAILPTELGGRSVVLVGTNRGLAILDRGDVKVLDTSSGLPNDIVRSLHIRELEGERELWVGTGGGVAWTPLDGAFRWRILTDETEPALPSNTVYRIEEDRAGRIYLFTSRGVKRLELGDGTDVIASKTFTTADGLPSNEINFGASMVDSRGRIWAGTPTGAAIFDPELETEDPQGTLMIKSVQVDHEPVAVRSHYHLDSDRRSLSVELLLVDLDGGESARYRAWLEGPDPQPMPWSSNPRIELASLAPGDYRLLAEAMDDLGNQYGPLELMISIEPPVWRQWWAIVSYVLVVLLIVGLAVQARVRALQRRTATLEDLVRSRTRDLEKTNRELETANRSLSVMTETDPLTGARNRRWVSLHLESEANRVIQSTRRGDDLLLIVVDIDHFKSVNDRFGHAIGDQVLRHFHDVLARTVRESDTIVRWGGEEFLIIARRTSREEATMIARRLVDEVRAEPFEAEDGVVIHLTCSVGVAAFPFDPTQRELITWQQVLDIADHGLYTVKESGRDGWVALFGGEAPSPPDVLTKLREEPRDLVRAGYLHVESSFDRDEITWPSIPAR